MHLADIGTSQASALKRLFHIGSARQNFTFMEAVKTLFFKEYFLNGEGGSVFLNFM